MSKPGSQHLIFDKIIYHKNKFSGKFYNCPSYDIHEINEIKRCVFIDNDFNGNDIATGNVKFVECYFENNNCTFPDDVQIERSLDQNPNLELVLFKSNECFRQNNINLDPIINNSNQNNNIKVQKIVFSCNCDLSYMQFHRYGYTLSIISLNIENI